MLLLAVALDAAAALIMALCAGLQPASRAAACVGQPTAAQQERHP